MALNTLAGLSLRDLEYASALAELRHFGRAAERCGVSQPTLSEQVRKLEALLGVALFERRPRHVALTVQGEALLPQIRATLQAARGLMERAQGEGTPLAGRFRLGVIATLGPYYVPALLREVRARFPNLELRLQESRTATLAEALEEGELDAALLALPPPTEGFLAEPLFFEPFLLACPRGHPLANVPRVELAALRRPDLLLLEEGHCLRDQALSLCRIPRGAADARFATSLEMLRHMIAAGEGISLLPQLAAQGRTDLGGLVVLRPLAEPDVGRRIGLVWRATDPREKAYRELAGFLRKITPERQAA